MWNPSISPYLRALAEPDAPCLADDWRRWTARDVAARVEAIATHLEALGVGAGDVVAVMMSNRLELILTLFAAWRRGAAVTPINPAFTAAEARFQLDDSGARAVVVDEALRAKVDGAAAAIVVAEALDALPRAETIVVPPPPAGLALLIYTSGTTGTPKGVMLGHDNLAAMIDAIVPAARVTASDHSLLVLPLFHVNGLVVGTLAPLAVGGRVTVGPRFDPASFWGVIARARPTYFSAVPTMYLMLLASAIVPPDVSSLRIAFCGAAPMPRDAIGAFERRFGVPLVEGYGLSEATVCSTLNPLDGPRKAGTVGVPLPGQEVVILGPDDRPLPRGARGEVGVRGATVMHGYWKRPDDTAAALRGGVLHTGDIGYFDDDGYLVLVDRSKDMIIRGGENIYPKEIETVLHAHAAVLEAAVVGAPDPRLGEVPVAFVELRPGARATEAELVAHCRATLAHFKVPTRVWMIDALPRNAVGKVSKPALRARLASLE
jgi:acyl-CoA synthetase (AMP-forming)/AMP-acid ligase II